MILIPQIDRYEELDDDVKYEFRVTLCNFNKRDNYILQIVIVYLIKHLKEIQMPE